MQNKMILSVVAVYLLASATSVNGEPKPLKTAEERSKIKAKKDEIKEIYTSWKKVSDNIDRAFRDPEQNKIIKLIMKKQYKDITGKDN